MEPAILFVAGGILVAAIDRIIRMSKFAQNDLIDFILTLLGKFFPEPTDAQLDALIAEVRAGLEEEDKK